MKKSKRLVQGIGINDVDYNVQEMINLGIVNGKRKNIRVWTCPYYKKWNDVLTRVNPKNWVKYPAYVGTSICEDWKYLSKFKSWMENQIWENGESKLHLDKDILVPGNKIYGPETCAFVPGYLNSLLTQSDKARGKYPIGVSRDKIAPDMKNYLKKSYRASIKKRDTQKPQMLCLGMFATPEEAHRAWQRAKIENILDYIKKYRLESCYSIAVESSLMLRVYQLQEDLKNDRETIKL